MSNLMMWNLIVGFLMPNVVALIQQPRFTEPTRVAITALVSVVGGFATAFFNDQFNFEDVVGSILVTGVAAITFYKGFWKPAGVAPAIENATSRTPPTVQQAHPTDGPEARIDPHRSQGGYSAVYLLVVVLLVLLVIYVLFALVG